MDTDRIFSGLENLLSILHIAILFLSTLMFTFVFIINWEDWFFDIKLAGPAAGLFLATKASGAVILMYVVMQYPDRWKAVLPGSIAYFGFLFVNATVTYQITAPGSFPVLLALLFIIPVLLLVLKLFTASFKKNTMTTHDRDTLSCTLSDKDNKRSINPLLLLFLGMILIMVFVILILPLGISLIVTNVPSLHQMVLPPAHDTVLVKVDNAGKREWTYIIPGYSLDFVQLVDDVNESFLLFGTYWMPEQDEAQIRVIRIERDGDFIWDMTRSMKFGSGTEGTAQIAGVEPRGAGAVIWLTNGRSLRLDDNGAVIGETSKTDILQQQTTESHIPPRFTVTELPAPAATIRIYPDGGQEIVLTVEDTISHKEIRSVYAINPTADGGYLISASVNH